MAKKIEKIDSNDENTVRQMIADLENIEENRLNDAVCDIIDIGSKPILMLIEALPDMSEEVGSIVVQKLEDFFYFHPEKGEKVVEKICKRSAGKI